MKKRIQLHHTAGTAAGGSAGFGGCPPASDSPSPRTGDHCPANGWWAPLTDGAAVHYITEGSIMPTVGGNPSRWKLVVRHLHREQMPSYEFPPAGFALDSIDLDTI
ncbi:hypothetical protein [Arthrobacter globiformis]|uniref:Uncharacterized protein n=1 Tax=Arthrobacter globiformis TaxID=1665 RepID=A0A328HMD9_ARTGO|nr:hypothetical protein [Arthrobacter globiformis]RAM38400.1 hypothetical protein DBZ45_05210 [Arthrobacter globiformis]